ncbi:uncharacterized protein PITG_14509 [Phytophthora infestans T30-4]|uniref:Uncharacterized protein n=1 Tax=Phytophthora infestans (strain T30-4) TaxID=403677 RepID=D0NQ09_PHYIT|nr:uncharacterized protein PITG_14509 [Phytophthora infestans T30-4]EEY62721.1 hypothetical protein PITG_14509 [Phytophthora infestans T30-4]|eukprot:XP_002898963.1 hypothetical protein PITG_14509 [Phytophthora infestans T30-4]
MAASVTTSPPPAPHCITLHVRSARAITSPAFSSTLHHTARKGGEGHHLPATSSTLHHTARKVGEGHHLPRLQLHIASHCT